MPRVWLSIGSNIDRERYIRSAIKALREQFGELVLSTVYETPAEGFEGDPFYNLVVGIETELPPAQLQLVLRAIEDRHDRERAGPKFSGRTLDIDMLTYADQVTEFGGKVLPRDEIVRYAFVLGPLAEVAPRERHPSTGQTYGALWAAFDRTAHGTFKPIHLEWD